MIECKKKQILQAIEAIKYMNEKFFEDESKKKPLIEENSIFLQVTLKKIPSRKLLKIIKVPLPNSLVGDTSDVCLITGDLDKNDRKAEIEPTVLHYKDFLKQHGVKENVEVIPLRQLRTEYKAYEAKRQLVAAYDVFLADNKIAGVLPKLLGKFFFRKRKFPIQIDMQSSNLKDLIQKASSSTVFFFSNRGNSCTAEIGNLDMTVEEVKQNILAAVRVLSERVPGGYDNIMGIFVKTLKSKAVPIYMSYGSPNEVKFESLKVKELVEAEELSTLPNKKVKVFRDGKIIVKNCKNESESEDDSDVIDEDSCPESVDNDEKAATLDSDAKSENSNTEEVTVTNSKVKKSLKRKRTSKKIIKQKTSEENKYPKEETRSDDINDIKECKSIQEKNCNQKLEKEINTGKEESSQKETVIDNFAGAATLDSDGKSENPNTEEVAVTNSKVKKSLKRKTTSKKIVKQNTSEENKYPKEEIRSDDINDIKESKSIQEKNSNQKLKKYSKNCKITVLEKEINTGKEESPQKETVIDNFAGEQRKLKGNKFVEKQNKRLPEKEIAKGNKLLEDINPAVKQSKINEGIDRSPKKAITGKREYLKRRQFYKLKKRLKLANELKKAQRESKSPKHRSGRKKKP
ncbi:Ribosomal L1 domain-containing protein 1, partial [Stegodyphus mimosarum]